VRAPGRNAPLIRFLISALYILFACLYRLLPHLSFFFTFPYLSPPLLIFPLRTTPLYDQAGCCKKRLNLALVFWCLFGIVIHFFWVVNAWFCCVRFSIFSIASKRLARGNVSEMTYFVSSGISSRNSIDRSTNFYYCSCWCCGGVFEVRERGVRETATPRTVVVRASSHWFDVLRSSSQQGRDAACRCAIYTLSQLRTLTSPVMWPPEMGIIS